MTCTSENCDKPVKNKKRGLCARCYQYWLMTEAPHKPRCPEEDCTRPISLKGKCNIHGRPTRTGEGRGAPGKARGKRNLEGRFITSNGYVRVRIPEVQENGGWVLEHRYVMEQHLGRPLAGDENVHHLDGNRQNNSLDNLELWVKFQPPGQRVEDLVAYAKQLIERYGD